MCIGETMKRKGKVVLNDVDGKANSNPLDG